MIVLSHLFLQTNIMRKIFIVIFRAKHHVLKQKDEANLSQHIRHNMDNVEQMY